MKKVLPTLLAVLLIVGAIGAAGFAGYQYGYRQAALSISKNDSNVVIAPGINPHGMMPMHNFGDERGFGRGNFGMMEHGRMGFGFFAPIRFLVSIVFWALVIWAVYTLIVRSGWHLTRTVPTATTPPVETVETVAPTESDENKST